MSDSIVQQFDGAADAPWKRAVVLSAEGSGLPLSGMRRNLPASALLELADGSVHRLKSRGTAFTPDSLGAIADAVLQARSGKVRPHGSIEIWLREIMALPSAELTDATPDDLISASWSIRPWAVALVLHERQNADINDAAVTS